MFFVWRIENFGKLQLPQSSIFFAKTLHMFPTYHAYKKVLWIVLFCLDLELFSKIKKRPDFYTLDFYIFINNSRSKQNKKNFSKKY